MKTTKVLKTVSIILLAFLAGFYTCDILQRDKPHGRVYYEYDIHENYEYYSVPSEFGGWYDTPNIRYVSTDTIPVDTVFYPDIQN